MKAGGGQAAASTGEAKLFGRADQGLFRITESGR